MSVPINLFDYEAQARGRLHPAVWDYISCGAEDELTLAENRAAFGRVALRPRVMAETAPIDISTRLLGADVAAPIMIAPTASHSMLCPEAEIATVEAAGRAGIPMVASSNATLAIGEIGAAAKSPLWFQLYLLPLREATVELVRRAEAAGCTAIALTVDSPLWGRKERSWRTEGLIPWPSAGTLAGLPPGSVEGRAGAPASWADVDWLRTITKLPIVLKGVVTAEDAAIAADRGVEAICVSNHGGRQLDGMVATLDALPEVVEAAGARCEIYVDGGVRRGSDVLKALALGARAVMVGRPVLWGLAMSGSAGAFDVLEMLKRELVNAMSQCGRPTIASIDRTLVR